VAIPLSQNHFLFPLRKKIILAEFEIFFKRLVAEGMVWA
jgi:hypothetical protein